MGIIKDYLDNYKNSEFHQAQVKCSLKDFLCKHNVVLNDECLNGMLDFIDKCETKFIRPYKFIQCSKTKTDEFYLTADISLSLLTNTCPFSPTVKSQLEMLKLGNNKTLPLYVARHPKNCEDSSLILYYMLNGCIFKLCNEKPTPTVLLKVTLEDIIEYANETGDACHFEIISKDDTIHNKVFYGENNILSKKVVYKIDFGEYGIYIGQTKNIATRMEGHKNSAKNKTHCYVINTLYKNNPILFENALSNVKILDKPMLLDKMDGFDGITTLEYQYQVEALRNGEKLLGRQCWDNDFKKFLSYCVDENEYLELLEKSYVINNNPKINKGYSKYNACEFHKELMEMLRKKEENT